MSQGTGLQHRLSQALLRSWTHRGLAARLLWPLSLLYRAVFLLRRALYGVGLYPSRSVPCAVIVVGNSIVGGAGKTPTTIGIVQHLRARGLAVGVVSRGHGRAGVAVQAVSAQSDAQDVGDEPLLIARATGVPVFVASSRWDAATALLAAFPQTRVLVCDDGLQHYALQRDIEVCVFDERGIGNGWLLPAGPLREPWPRTPLACVGQSNERLLVLHTGAQAAFAGFRAQRSLSSEAAAQDAKPRALSALQPPLLALAGIARPEVFFASLRAMGLVLDKTLALPDHFDFAQLDRAALSGYQVLCTEKDAVKLWRYLPEALAVPLIQTLEPNFLAALDLLLDATLAAKLSSDHGHQTA
jgi:tetraacyldisaccharide 4'-kinase